MRLCRYQHNGNVEAALYDDSRIISLNRLAAELGVKLRDLEERAEEAITRSNARLARSEMLISLNKAAVERDRATAQRDKVHSERDEVAIRREAANTGLPWSEVHREHFQAMSRAETAIRRARALREDYPHIEGTSAG